MAATAVGALATLLIASGWTGPETVSLAGEAIVAWGRFGSIALLWVAMAAGFGVWLEPLVCGGNEGVDRSPGERLALTLAFGVAAGLAVDALAGSLGVLLLGRGIGTWVVTGAGLVLLVLRLRSGDVPRPRLADTWTLIGMAVPAGVLLLAATSAPGWLWRSEFGGYDALSYHLELPKEWLLAGQIATFPHNVYSALPSFVEASFLHLFILTGNHEGGAIAAQCLVAIFSLIAAANVAAAARRFGGRAPRWLAAALYLATPWIVVVGSLAYNDGVVCLFLAAALALLAAPPKDGVRLGVGLGVLLAAACGAKLTASGFVVLPVVVALLVVEKRRALIPLAIAFPVGFVVLASWLVRNTLATENPVFPFASGLFGTGWWSDEQVAIFKAAHASPLFTGGNPADALGRIWSQWIAFGIGAPSTPGEPWIPQWSVLPAIGLVGLALLWRAKMGRSARILSVVVASQVVFWVLFTHEQSRFLVPTAVPLAVAAATAMHAILRSRLETIGTGVAALASLAPLMVFAGEGVIRLPSAPNETPQSLHAPALFTAAIAAATGDLSRAAIESAPDEETRRGVAASSPLSFALNHALGPKDLIVLVGHARPFWYRRGNDTMHYTTVWDRGILDALAAELPDGPRMWAAQLGARGVRYVVLDWAMLKNWSDKGWLNPLLTRDRLTEFASTMTLRRQTPDGVELREIAPPAPALLPAPPALQPPNQLPSQP